MHPNLIANHPITSLIARFATVCVKTKGNAEMMRFGMKLFALVSAARSSVQTTFSGMMLLANVNALQKLAVSATHGTQKDAFAIASLKTVRMILTTITSSTEKNALAHVTHLLKLAKKDSFTIPMFVHASVPHKNVHRLLSGTKKAANASAKLISAQQIPTGDLILMMKTTAAASANLAIAQTITIGTRPFVIAFALLRYAQINTSGMLSSVNADVLLLTAAANKFTQFTTLILVLAFALKTKRILVKLVNILTMFLANASAHQVYVKQIIIGIQESATASPSIANAQLDSTSILIQKLVNA